MVDAARLMDERERVDEVFALLTRRFDALPFMEENQSSIKEIEDGMKMVDANTQNTYMRNK